MTLHAAKMMNASLSHPKSHLVLGGVSAFVFHLQILMIIGQYRPRHCPFNAPGSSLTLQVT